MPIINSSPIRGRRIFYDETQDQYESDLDVDEEIPGPAVSVSSTDDSCGSSEHEMDSLSTCSTDDSSIVTEHTDKRRETHDEVGPMDVLLGRGGATNSNEGNVRFRQLVQENKELYEATKQGEKYKIAQKIVSEWKKRGGRFLERGTPSRRHEKGQWKHVEQKRAFKKTFQCLRSKTPHIRTMKAKEGLHVVIPRKNASRVACNEDDDEYEFRDQDVVFGSPRHAGTVWYRRLIRCNRPLYNVSSPEGKQLLCKAMINAVENQSPPGRFFEMKKGIRHSVTIERIMLKTTAAFRQSAREPKLRRITSRDLDAAEALIFQQKSPVKSPVEMPEELPSTPKYSKSQNRNQVTPEEHHAKFRSQPLVSELTKEEEEIAEALNRYKAVPAPPRSPPNLGGQPYEQQRERPFYDLDRLHHLSPFGSPVRFTSKVTLHHSVIQPRSLPTPSITNAVLEEMASRGYSASWDHTLSRELVTKETTRSTPFLPQVEQSRFRLLASASFLPVPTSGVDQLE